MTDRKRSLLMDLAVACFLLIVAVTLFFPVLKKSDSLIYNADISYFFPHEVVIEHSYAKGDFPLWNPYFGGGSPGLSKIQVGLFYPPMVLLRLLLPPIARLNWDAVFNLFIAGLGVYWLVRDMVTSRTAALFSALAFMLSGSIIPRVFAGHVSVLHAVVWTGWLLFAYRRMLYRHSWRYLVLTVLFASCVVLGGHPQMSAIVLLVPISYFIFVYVIENIRSQRWAELARGLGLSVLVAFLAAGLTAAQVFPFAEWLTYTPRGSGVAFDSFEIMTRNSVQLQHLVTPFIPLAWFNPESSESISFVTRSLFWEISPFVGFLTIFLIVSGLILVRDQNRHLTIYLIGMALFALVMSMGTYNPIYTFIYDKLPYIRAPGRFLLLWTFSFAILAGIFLDELLKLLSSTNERLPFKRIAYTETAITLILIALIIWWNANDSTILSQLHVSGNLANYDPIHVQALLQRSTLIVAITLTLVTGLFWLATIPAVKSNHWGWLTIAILVFELVLFARPLVRPYPVNKLIDPQNPLANLEIDPSAVRIDGYREPPNYLVPTLHHVQNGEEHIALRNLLKDKEKGQQLLSASYYATNEPIEDPDIELIQQKESAFLYRHVNTSPRIYASDSVSIVQNDVDALDFILATTFNQYEQSVLTIVPENEFASAQDLGLSETAVGAVNFSGEYITYGNNEISAHVFLDRPAIVIFNELYYPGWQATIDGEQTDILKTNYIFRGVIVEKGEHTIEMRFSPPIFRLGVMISLTTAIIMVMISLWIFIRHRNIFQL